MLNIQTHLKNSSGIENELKSYFELENTPYCIEVYDNSHLQGSARVGAMICYKWGNFEKENYRKFHLSAKNEYEQMKELLTRRISHFDKISPPDLWLIDGGKALLDLARDLVCKSGANIDVLAISKEKINSKAHRAKGSARDKVHSLKAEFCLNPEDKKLQFLQKLRDEAHRFAIQFHQNTKKNQDLQSSKLAKLGVSKAALQKLLRFFGTFDAIYQASFTELRELTNKKTAQKIKSIHSSTKD